MHKIESEILDKTPLKPKFFKRFVDNIIWFHGEEKLKDFIHLINNHHPTIKFTEEHSNKKILFLNTLVFKEDNKLKTKVYHKEQTKNSISTTNHATHQTRKMLSHMDS